MLVAEIDIEMPTASNPDEYSTRNLALAAAIVASGQILLRLDRVERVAFFIFSDGRTCGDLETRYWAGTLGVDAKAYADAERTIKDRLFGGKVEGDRHGQ